ncbi:MAG: LysR family transcriptional regulator [Pseudomonadota bacterium]
MINNKFSLKQLEAFVVVSRERSFRRAAAVLGTTQPNISSRIAALENIIDTVLFHRDAGSVKLSEKGKMLLPFAKEILLRSEELIDQAGQRHLVKERLRIGVTEIVACTWLRDFLRRMKATYPSISIELNVDLSKYIEEQMDEDKIDLAFQSGPFTREKYGSKLIDSYEYCWVAVPDFARKLKGNVELGMMFDFQILLHARNTNAPMELAAEAGKRGLRLEKLVHSNSLAACLPMAQEGLGIALLPYVFAMNEINQGRLAKIGCDWVPLPLTIYTRFKDKPVPKFVQTAASLAAEAAESLSIR